MNTNALFFLLFIIFVFSCENKEKPKKLKRVFIHSYFSIPTFQKKQWNDGEHIAYYENGNKKYQVQFSNGKLNGKCFFYYEKGALKEEVFYKDGYKNGISHIYYPDGKVWFKELWKNDTLINEQLEYYTNNNLMTYTYLSKEGRLLYQVLYDSNGVAYFECGKLPIDTSGNLK